MMVVKDRSSQASALTSQSSTQTEVSALREYFKYLCTVFTDEVQALRPAGGGTRLSVVIPDVKAAKVTFDVETNTDPELELRVMRQVVILEIEEAEAAKKEEREQQRKKLEEEVKRRKRNVNYNIAVKGDSLRYFQDGLHVIAIRLSQSPSVHQGHKLVVGRALPPQAVLGSGTSGRPFQ
jgi:hypothetical protein